MGKSLAQQLAKLANPAPEDFDPEDFERGSSGNSDSDTALTQPAESARAHYVKVDRSRLRDRAGALELEKSQKYKGSRVSRKDIEASSRESLDREQDLKNEEDEELSRVLSDELDSSVDHRSNEDLSSESDEDDSDGEEEEPETEKGTEDEVSRILAYERKAIVSRVSSESQADAEKGKAVQAQMRLYEDLLDIRIALQKVLNETNNNTKGKAEGLAMLCAGIVSKRSGSNVSNAPVPEAGVKRTLEQLDEEVQQLDESLSKRRETVLSRWSRKVQLSSGRNSLQAPKFKSLAQSATSQITSALSDMDRLVERTRVNRSQYDKTEEDPTLFDDTDFYRLLLKDLVDKRMNDPTLAKGLQWKSIKTKKNVDTKASKGRKLRYHVQEKIQGFDVPRQSVFNWSDDQAEELYSRLLGVEITMDDAEPASDHGEPETVVDEDFALFG